MYFYDVCKDYFQGYHHNLHPIYKAKGGKILKYNQCKPEIMYKKPMYTQHTQRQLKTTSYDAQRYLMYSTQDYKEVLQTLQGLRCKPAVVSFYYCINKSINTNSKPHFHSAGSQFDSQPHFHSEGIPIRSQISH